MCGTCKGSLKLGLQLGVRRAAAEASDHPPLSESPGGPLGAPAEAEAERDRPAPLAPLAVLLLSTWRCRECLA